MTIYPTKGLPFESYMQNLDLAIILTDYLYSNWT